MTEDEHWTASMPGHLLAQQDAKVNQKAKLPIAANESASESDSDSGSDSDSSSDSDSDSDDNKTTNAQTEKKGKMV